MSDGVEKDKLQGVNLSDGVEKDKSQGINLSDGVEKDKLQGVNLSDGGEKDKLQAAQSFLHAFADFMPEGMGEIHPAAKGLTGCGLRRHAGL